MTLSVAATSNPALACNLATFLRRIELREAIANWSLVSLQFKLNKDRSRVIRNARAITFHQAEVALTGPVERAILGATRVFERHRYARDGGPDPN